MGLFSHLTGQRECLFWQVLQIIAGITSAGCIYRISWGEGEEEKDEESPSACYSLDDVQTPPM